MSAAHLRLGVNIDHVATVRNARGGRHPDPIRAAVAAIDAGADGITAHLREDRRHIRDDDVARLMAQIEKPLNLEMAATPEMTRIALATKPHACCIVPERREERTTEGGLDAVRNRADLKPIVAELSAAGVRVSLFIAADARQIEAAADLGASVVELHTGAWCEAVTDGRQEDAARDWRLIVDGARYASRLGLEVHAGHGLDFATARQIASLSEIVELNIGHFLVGEAIFLGLPETLRRMRVAMNEGRSEAQ